MPRTRDLPLLSTKEVKILPYQQDFRSHVMLRHEAMAGLTRIHQKMNKIQKQLNNDAADAMAFAMEMMLLERNKGCIVIKEEYDS